MPRVFLLVAAIAVAVLLAPASARAAPQDAGPGSPAAGAATTCETPAAGNAATGAATPAAAAVAADSFDALVAREPMHGASVAVVVRGELVWSATRGLADAASGRAVCSDTRFRTGSVSKVLTALALLRLHEEGGIGLDADVRALVPAVAHQPHAITVRQLAGHLAGVRHYRSGGEYMNTRRYERVSDALVIFADDSLVAVPGAAYAYSSYGFNLLGAALGAADDGLAGDSYVAAVRRLVLAPLALAHVSPEASVPPGTLATPYSVRESVLVPSPPFDPSDRLPSGGWVASAVDLARVGYALVDPGFLSEDSRALLLESQRTGAGEETGTSIGLRVGVDEAGRRILHHGGTSVGARAFLLVYPDDGVAIALLANGPAEFAEEALGRIAAPFLGR